MKSISEDDDTCRIRLFGAWPGTELSVRDSRFNVVAQAVGHLDVSVPPGLYQVERRLGDAQDTEIVAVRPGHDHVDMAVELPVPSVAPIAADTRSSDRYRTLAESASAAAAHSDPAAGCLVVVADAPPGTVVGELQLLDEALRAVDGWQRGWAGHDSAAWHALVRPGGHVLRRDRTDTPLWVAAGWQTIVFLRHTPHGFDVSIHLVAADRPWQAHSAANTAVEVARTALLRHRAVFRRDVVDVLLRDRSDLNPMVGILAAHALRTEWPSDDATHDLITDRLLELLPGHPDVEALSLWRAGSITPARQRLAWPPMLHAAYRDLVIPSDVAAPGVIVEGSLTYQIAGNLISGGVWLKYTTLRPAEEPAAPVGAKRQPTVRAAARVRRFIADVAAVDGGSATSVATDWDAAAVALSTGLPVAAVADIMTGIRHDGEPPPQFRPLPRTRAGGDRGIRLLWDVGDGQLRHVKQAVHAYAGSSAAAVVTTYDLLDSADLVRTLTRSGTLRDFSRSASAEDRRRIRAGGMELVWPLVFTKVTQRFELARGHPRCAQGVRLLEPDCLDRFQDDVEAVTEHLFANADAPIQNLESWLTTRLPMATVAGHRKRRGARGATMRPRLPLWLVQGLGGDPWLTELATEILVWVAVEGTAGAGVWPLTAWADRRAERADDHTASEAAVAHDIAVVLAAMDDRPQWYERNIEIPLGRKQAPLWRPDRTGGGALPDPEPLLLVSDHEINDAMLREFAALALERIQVRVRRGEEPQQVVPEVLNVVFSAPPTGDRTFLAPGTDHTAAEQVERLIADPVRRERIVAAVLQLLDGEP